MKSKLTKINKNQQTVRVVIPKTVQEMLQIKAGDYINWKPDIIDGKVHFYIEKAEDE